MLKKIAVALVLMVGLIALTSPNVYAGKKNGQHHHKHHHHHQQTK